ncbi:hypothetical protein AAFF_G00076990 [Aldrovandia affinis]|uniref:Dynein axonemal intermediate chain 7 n=1 Tax=Aldrovandia affinis TaxID=143900 RepID=A0AAD7RXY3_9TELE|nr:hypothetical protein AAFF_G00076990 [Aldrovandia affinis]
MKKGKAKTKISKADRAKVSKEEQKRREKEDEDLRLQREQEERERMERERRRREKQEWLEQKDRGRRGDELDELSRMLEDNYFVVTQWQAQTRESAKWERYMNCDGSPNPSVPQEINSFISLWREDPEVLIGPILEDISLALRLIKELEGAMSDRGNSEQSEKNAQKDGQTLRSLWNLILCKLNLASEEILVWSNKNANMDTGNMHTVIRDKNITLCLWANLSKNSRLKQFRFEEVGMGFEMPRQLAVSDIAVRILHTRYDHLSPLSREVQRQESAAVLEEVPSAAKPEQTEQGEAEGEGDRRENSEPDGQSDKSSGRKSTLSVASEKEKSTVLQETPPEEGENETENIIEESATGEEDPVIAPPEPASTTSELDIVDLCQYMPLGGVFYFDVFHLPPQSKLIRGWEMRKLQDGELQAFPYPDQSQIQTAGKDDTSGSPPVGVTITLPQSVIFLEEPMVARWDPTALQWRRDGIYETTYDAPTSTISFKMDSFHTFTLLQDAYANMPFESWELRPLGMNSALLTISGGLTEVSITIKGKMCMLTSDPGSDKLRHMSGKWMSVSALQEALTSSGVNIFVNEHSSKYVSITAKDPLTEEAVYEQMAFMASTVAFSWSRWNAQCGQEHIVLQACQHLEADPVPAEAWSVFLLGAQRSQRLEMKEWSETFSPELADDSEFHSTFLHMLKDVMTLTGWRRVQESHYLFVDNVHRLLHATRVLTYS